MVKSTGCSYRGSSCSQLCLSSSSDLPGTVTHTVHGGKNVSCQGSSSRGNEEGLTESSTFSSEWQLIDLPLFYFFIYEKSASYMLWLLGQTVWAFTGIFLLEGEWAAAEDFLLDSGVEALCSRQREEARELCFCSKGHGIFECHT